MVSCTYCSVELRDQFNLKNHHKSNHQCKFCGNVFGQKENLKMHQKICSENKKALLTCTTCGKNGGELIGEQCNKVMDTIDKLEYLYPDEHKSIIDGFKAVKIVNKSLCGIGVIRSVR